MKLACIGDLHLHERSPRYAHVLDVLDFTIDDALAQGATHFALLGDLFEANPSGAEYAALLDRVHRMRAYDREVVAILGNHESPTALAFWHHVGVRVAWDSIVSLDASEARILAIPYPRRGRAPFNDLDGETIGATMQAAAARVANIVQAHRGSLATPKPLIVLAHFTIEGMTAGDSEFELHTATEVVVPRAAFEGCALAAVGHIHKAQSYVDALKIFVASPDSPQNRYGPEIIGTGSLIRHSFAEAGDEKSYTLVTVANGQTTWARRPVPARAMLVETMDWQPVRAANVVAANLLAMQAPGREVKLTVQIAEDQLATFNASVFDVVKDAAEYFVLERVTVSAERTRAPGIGSAASIEEQLSAWFAAIDITVSEERRARLGSKCAEVRG